MRTPVQVAAAFCSAALCAAVISEAQAQTMAVGNFVGFAGGAVQVSEGGIIKSVPMRVSAIVSIRGSFDLAELPKGSKVILQGRVVDGSKDVDSWSVTYYPMSRPLLALATRNEPTADRPGNWDLEVYCNVLETKPLKLQILPGNGHEVAVQDPVTKIWGIGAWGGKKVDGLIVTLDDSKRSQRRMTEVEFGPNPQMAGNGATVTVTGSGIPPMAEAVMIRRVEEFKVPLSKPIVRTSAVRSPSTKPAAPKPSATRPSSTRPAAGTPTTARPTATRSAP
jgi:hypothetical protein